MEVKENRDNNIKSEVTNPTNDKKESEKGRSLTITAVTDIIVNGEKAAADEIREQ